MSSLRAKFAMVLIVLSAVGALGTSSAAAAPAWNLELHHGPTKFAPGEINELWFTITNVGDDWVSEPAKLTVELPTGLTFLSAKESGWTCPTPPGATVVECESTEPLPPHSPVLGSAFRGEYFGLNLGADPSVVGTTIDVKALVEGGGAPIAVHDIEPIVVGSGGSSFGIVPGSFKADFFANDGITPMRRSGSHPDLATFAFDLNNNASPRADIPNYKLPAESLRDVEVELPPGFVGNPSAVGECKAVDLQTQNCPLSSQVGRIDIGAIFLGSLTPDRWPGLLSVGVFNMTHSRGSVTELGFNVSENIIRIRAELNPANGYAIKTVVPAINQFLPVYYQKLTIWGVPGDSSHDFERCGLPSEVPCSIESSGKSFLTTPFQCGVNHEMRLRNYDSWESPGAFGPEIAYPMPGESTDCDSPPFEPELSAEATGHEANSPTGLNVNIVVPQNENPNSVATPPVKSTSVTLPEGMTLSPSFASGLAGCSEAQFGISHSGVPNGAPVACPDNSRIGAVTLKTPLLPKELEGSLYLGNQGNNPFNSTFAIYLALHDTEERGVLLKIPGRIDLDPVTGKITSTFDDLPQLPFEEFSLQFRSGQRAPLINPPTCGTTAIVAKLSSYAQPGEEVEVSSTYGVSQGAKGTPCPSSSEGRAFSPRLSAGTVNPNAGSFSPFQFEISRDDQEQEFGRITATLPPGVLAKIAGIPYCPESAIASISAAEGTGRAELTTPACSPASRIGSVSTGVGAGNEPNFFPGSVYLAGPYKAAPLSLAIVVPALAGPYDLGSVVVRAGIFVDPATAEVKAESDPLPSIVHGVLLRVRDVRIDVDRPDTFINPTSCDPLSVRTSVLSLGGASANPLTRFQVGNCSRLDYSPKLAMRFSGATKRSGNPALRAVLTQSGGQANNGRISVTLPRHEFIDNAHINNPCTRPQFSEGKCPPNSILGFARAFTPLLGKPLEGSVYFRSNGGERELPDLVVALRGQFDVNLVGFIDAVQKKGSETSRVRTTFANLPDAPVSKFVLSLYGGKRGLLENSVNLCKVTSRAGVKALAQSGKTRDFSQVIATGCGRKDKGGKARRSPNR